MLRRSIPIMFILLFVFLLVLPAFAQDVPTELPPTAETFTAVPSAEPTAEVTAQPTPAPEQPPVIVQPKWWESETFWLVAISLAAIVVVVGLQNSTIHKLAVGGAAKLPGFIYAGTKEAALQGITVLERKADETPDPGDNQEVAKIRKAAEDYFKEVDAARMPQIKAQITAEVTKQLDNLPATIQAVAGPESATKGEVNDLQRQINDLTQRLADLPKG